MARPIVLSNGELHVGLNKFGMVHDFYYPYVGQENHASSGDLRHRIGVWVDGGFSWLDDGEWSFHTDYPYQSLVGRTSAYHAGLSIALEFDDCVDAHQSALLRNIHIVNCSDTPRTIKLFMHQVFIISNSNASDTAQYLPHAPGIVHYKSNRVFIVSGQHQDKRPFDQFSVGIYGIENREGTYKDAENGTLSSNPVEHGSVDSVLGYELALGAHDSGRVQYWISAGKSMREALVIHNRIVNEGLLHRLLLTNKWWGEWLQPAQGCIEKLPPQYSDAFVKSLMLMKSHIDKRGAVIASTDTTMLNYWRDAYGYCWPRDAAFVLWPLIRLGYTDEPLQFFNFCRRILHPDGYLMQKYQADGAVGSSWHPYVHENGIIAPPIQEDETAIVLFMLLQYFHYHDDPRNLREFYNSLVRPMANFLASYVDTNTKLPKPSYDLWEETFLTSTYTTAVTHSGLQAAMHLAEKVGENEDAIRWGNVANEMCHAARNMLYNKERKFFYHGITAKGEEIEFHDRIDSSSFYGAFMFGLFDLHSDEVRQSYDTLKQQLVPDPSIVGVPRYENDKYNVVDPASIGNPWFISTLWMAQYHMEIDQKDQADTYIQWTVDRMTKTGVLPEQINPYSRDFISVAPLVWSQAELVNTLLDHVIDPPHIEETPNI